MSREEIVIGIGSNLGDRLSYIQKALSMLESIFQEMRCSSLVESAAHLLPGSPPEWDLPFLNCVVVGFCSLLPDELLRALQEIERKMGSFKTARWAPRTIDLDILAYGKRVIQQESLMIPHKELLSRPFWLFPLGQLLPYWEYPVPESSCFGKTVVELTHTSSSCFDRTFLPKPYLVGILNITPDSFSDGGLFVEKESAVAHAKELWQSGASFIDIGAASTRPGALFVSPEDEWSRLQPVLAVLKGLPTPPRISIDTYHPETAIRAIVEFDVEIINFVGPEVPQELAWQIEKSDKKLICMHSLSLPPTRVEVLPLAADPVQALSVWAEQTIERLARFGLHKDRIILDPGIGFGKSSLQNLMILKRIQELKRLGVSILVGHSRKSFMHVFTSYKPQDRDWQSAALSLHLFDQGVDYLRVHDVRKHMELLVAHQSLVVGEQYALP